METALWLCGKDSNKDSSYSKLPGGNLGGVPNGSTTQPNALIPSLKQNWSYLLYIFLVHNISASSKLSPRILDSLANVQIS